MIKVTVNTDDPGVSDITLSDDYYKVMDQFGFGLGDLEKIILNGVDAAFLPEDEKTEMKAKFGASMDELAKKYYIAQQENTRLADL